MSRRPNHPRNEASANDTLQTHYKNWQISKGALLKSYAYSVLSHQTETHTFIMEAAHAEQKPYFIFEECSVIPIEDLRMISSDVYREVELMRKSHVLSAGKKLMLLILIVDNVMPMMTRIIPLEFDINDPALQEAGLLSSDAYREALNSP